MAMYKLQIEKALDPVKTWQRPLSEKISDASATSQTFYIDIPRDHFIHEIIISIEESTASGSGNYEDDITEIELVANGNKTIKKMLGSQCKQIMKLNKDKPATGFYKLYFSDPKIRDAKPLPSWVFTSLQLIIKDNAPATGNKHYINVTLIESAYRGEDLSNWKVLVEKFLIHKTYGTATGWQEYEHERAYKVYGYLYTMDDNGTLSNTIFNKLKLVGRKPDGEYIIVSEVSVNHIRAMNNAEIGVDTLDTGFMALEWANGFPTAEFTALKSYLNIPNAGTNAGLRVLERYVL
jgi:hypothetical protein